jgi:ribonuclease D
MLAEAGVTLGNVHDTAIAARMLGRMSTGLASLVLAEFGVALDKSMQQHDWTQRPIEARELSYLSADVEYLEALDERIWSQVQEKGIESEVLEETAYRIGGAVRAAGEVDNRPAYARLKGAERHALLELAILRELCNVRETIAREVDLPVHKIMANEALQAIARSRPRTVDELRKIRGVPIGVRHGLATGDLLRAVERGITSGTIPEPERAWFERPRIPAEVIRQRRGRETRLMQWRKEEAKRRDVDEQVVLPGHCVKDLAEAEGAQMADVAAIPGIGRFRVERDGASILQALAGS